jgi:hypothetical protein
VLELDAKVLVERALDLVKVVALEAVKVTRGLSWVLKKTRSWKLRATLWGGSSVCALPPTRLLGDALLTAARWRRGHPSR